MLQRGQTTEERIAQIAQGFGQGLNNFMTMRNQANSQAMQKQGMELRAQELQAEALRRQQALEREDRNYNRQLERDQAADKRTDRELGLREREYNLKAEELKLPFEQTREFQKAKAIAGLKQETNQKDPKQNEYAAAGYAQRARQAVADLSKLPKSTGTGTLDTFNNYVPEVWKGQNTKLFEQAKRNFITANLRKESGATIGDDEFAIEEKKYFAQPGDTPAVLAQKERAREQAIKNLEAEGSNALSRVPGYQAQSVNMTQASPARVSPQAIQQVKSMSDEELLRFVQGQ